MNEFILNNSFIDIAIARQIFQNKVFFFTSWGSFPYKKKKKVFMKNLRGASNIPGCFSNFSKKRIFTGA
jgi:hypothetical protein